MASYRSEKMYLGDEKIVIALDIGTTMSAASYSHLFKRSYPSVEMVTQWPGQPTASGSAKIPTLVLYDGSRCVACGEEALNYELEGHEELAKWFKASQILLHMHPDSLKDRSLDIPPLPTGIPVKRIYKDMMEYMFKNTQKHFETKVPNGASIWSRHRANMEFVFAIPNGWDYVQQQTMRQAAIDAGFFPSHRADSLLHFVTEGEASVHFVSVYGSMRHWLSVGSTFGVVDAGGSTTDSTLYTCTEMTPDVVLKEAGVSECVQAAGVNVDDVLGQILKAKLANSRFGDEENIKAMIEAFELKTKRMFDGNTPTNVIKFGGNRDMDMSVGIIKGQISLKKEEVLAAFTPVLENIVGSIRRLMSSKRPKYLLLVGGFGESPYLKSRLNDLFGGQGIEIVTVEQPTKKAAAEGAVIWYLKNMVRARVARETYGTDVRAIYNALLHGERSHKVERAVDGLQRISHVFDTWVQKGTTVDDGFSYTAEYHYSWPKIGYSKPKLAVEEVEVYMWDRDTVPTWAKEENGSLTPGLRRICTVKADLSALNNDGIRIEKGPNGEYWKADFQVAVTLPIGGAQLQARLQWHERGVLKQGPAITIVSFD
ncbi:SubName: Full=Uncharacterized protein {ECO:0000313/EMBL:CCA75659.1} [Serendipita indica DSM 11827]|nr:SubName: Full=Uncharacterized protein {ECO:0000313/EMBL:CCA75659.1} [Serendipita indica DSM 11827]